MLARGLRELDPQPGALVFVENVGNLVCPALFDLGERARVVVASVTEGEDKPAQVSAHVRGGRRARAEQDRPAAAPVVRRRRVPRARARGEPEAARVSGLGADGRGARSSTTGCASCASSTMRGCTRDLLAAARLHDGPAPRARADHLAAVASLSARAERPGALVRVAGAWGVGHGLAILAIACLWVATGVTVPDQARPFVEAAAGLLLVWLGVDLFRERGALPRTSPHTSIAAASCTRTCTGTRPVRLARTTRRSSITRIRAARCGVRSASGRCTGSADRRCSVCSRRTAQRRPRRLSTPRCSGSALRRACCCSRRRSRCRCASRTFARWRSAGRAASPSPRRRSRSDPGSGACNLMIALTTRRRGRSMSEKPTVHLLWINAGLSCDGDSVALTAATQPSIEEIVLGALPGLPNVAVHWPLIDYDTGEPFIEWFWKGIRGEIDPFVLVVEGSIPNEAIKQRGLLGRVRQRPGHGPADDHERMARPARAARVGDRRRGHVRVLWRHPRDGRQSDRRDGRRRSPGLGLSRQERRADRERAGLPDPSRQSLRDAALPALSGSRCCADDPARQRAAADLAVRQHRARGLRPRGLLRAGRLRDDLRLARSAA